MQINGTIMKTLRNLLVVTAVAGATTFAGLLGAAVLNDAGIGQSDSSSRQRFMPYREIGNVTPRLSDQCPVRNFVQVDVPAEARRIETQIAELLPRIHDIETNDATRQKAAAIVGDIERLRNTNVLRAQFSADACGTAYQSTLPAVMQQMLNDQGLRFLGGNFPRFTALFYGDGSLSSLWFTSDDGKTTFYLNNRKDAPALIWMRGYTVFVYGDGRLVTDRADRGLD